MPAGLERASSYWVPFGLVEACGGEGQQLGSGGQVPVRPGRSGVSEIGRQPRHPGRDIHARSVPVDQGVDREGVAQVVDPRPAGSGAGLEAYVAHQASKGPMDVLVDEPGTSHGDEEGRSRLWPALVAQLRVHLERVDRAWVKR